MYPTPFILILTLITLLPNPTLTQTKPSLPAPIPFASLPSLYTDATTPQNPVNIAQILNTLSLYPLAIDGKNFTALSEVFTEDAIVSQPIHLTLSSSRILGRSFQNTHTSSLKQ